MTLYHYQLPAICTWKKRNPEVRLASGSTLHIYRDWTTYRSTVQQKNSAKQKWCHKILMETPLRQVVSSCARQLFTVHCYYQLQRKVKPIIANSKATILGLETIGFVAKLSLCSSSSCAEFALLSVSPADGLHNIADGLHNIQEKQCEAQSRPSSYSWANLEFNHKSVLITTQS